MPNRYVNVNPNSGFSEAVNQINQNFRKLDSEAVTKKFGSGDNQVIIGKAGNYTGMVVGDLSTNAIIYGRYKPDKLGTLHIQNGLPSELQGEHPVTGQMGHWISKPGLNVITELGGTW